MIFLVNWNVENLYIRMMPTLFILLLFKHSYMSKLIGELHIPVLMGQGVLNLSCWIEVEGRITTKLTKMHITIVFEHLTSRDT